VKKFDDMCNRFDTIPACDGQTSCDDIVRAYAEHRAVRAKDRVQSYDASPGACV